MRTLRNGVPPTEVTTLETPDGRLELIKLRKKVVFVNAAGKTWETYTLDGTTYIPRVGSAVEQGRVIYPPGVDAPQEPKAAVGTIIRDVRSYLLRWTPMPEPFAHLAAVFAVMTWVYRQFPVSPYLSFLGETGTGKTRCLEAVGFVCYLPYRATGADSESTLYRTLHNYLGTLLLDEAEYKSTTAADLITKIMTTGYKRDASVSRCGTETRDYQPEYFRCGGPKILSSREPHQDRAISARSFRLQTTSLAWRDDISSDESQMRKEASKLSMRLLWLGLTQEVRQVDQLPVEGGRGSGHTIEVARPLVAVARHCGDVEGERVILDFVRLAGEQIATDRALSREATVLRAISRLSASDEEISCMAVSHATRPDEPGYQQHGKPALSAKQVGAVLDTLGIRKARGGAGGRTLVHLEPGQLDRLLEMWGLNDAA